ncbi:aspartate/glutamate racemase family protein [Phyllobacterium sp. 21LDTY02-6]|uniref:aspartate/glutamate racemase family protein n=1 Tax=unclassified Phyllobacterium TaxID=2638441 RepID=UPI0020219F5E|nr:MULTISPECIES: aspartate/glutamate racemase family protein [unclassified Phyllobacterium]MCO4317886.1 aspartate/glutamate racemase family protein [Phyllobacterium sp. 21LDTY02-6]MCX8282069.1 aspartate/glutamate racemase family protein [Phyllobacterium sp. 0TCS1.6C]MCX8296239.1 aspartate/glutamate racemase family protein [Phyllobacterium sp. 0TCS1.6A]
MKILMINPNTSTEMTDRMIATAQSVLAPDTELIAHTATRGFPYIASRAEAMIAGNITLEMLAEHHHGCDAAVIAAFGDPSLIAARELFEIPITAMAEAAILTSCMLGERFAMLTFSRTLVAWYEDAVALAGLTHRCAAIRVPDVSFKSVSTVQYELENEIVALAERTVKEDGADVLILAGAPLAGLAQRIAHRSPVPLVDPLVAAVSQAQTLARMKPKAASAGRFARPGPKVTVGLPQSLADWIEHRGPDRQSDLTLNASM